MAATGFTSLGIAGATSVGNNYGDLYNLYSQSTQTPGNTFAGFYTRSSEGVNNDLYTQYPPRQQGDPKNAPQTGFYTMQPNGSFNDVNDTILMPKFNQLKDASGNIGLGKNGNQYSVVIGTISALRGIFALNANDVYVGGGFTTSTGAVANYAARWDGSKFKPWLNASTDTGFNASPVSIHGCDASNIYIGGSFTNYTPNLLSCNYVLKWNGSSFVSLGPLGASGGITKWPTGSGGSQISTIFVLDPSNIYIGGNFKGSGALTCNNIIRWNGTSMNKMGGGLGTELETVFSIYAVSASEVYVGGEFLRDASGTTIFNNIARWNGNAFVQMYTSSNIGLNGVVSAIHGANDTSNIYIGGAFTAISAGVANSLNNIAIWNGSSFTAMGNGVYPVGQGVRSIFAVDSSNVYIGGNFSRLYNDTNDTLYYITKWNGNRFTRLLTGVNPSSSKIAYPGLNLTGNTPLVISISVPKNDTSNIFIGGRFSNPNGMAGTTFNSIARWGY